MKDLINFHMHSNGSDGNLPPEEVVKEAIASGINFMCFTDHYRRPREIKTDWNTEHFHSEEYTREIKNLQKKYGSKIDIACGAEFEWLPNHISWIKKELSGKSYDFIIGSMHLIFNGKDFFKFMFRNGQADLWLASAKKFGSIKAFVKAYYDQMRSMVQSGLFDCVGHFDVIKMHNKNSSFFSEAEDWYKKEVMDTLDVIQCSGMAMEINTSGLTRDVAAQYPSLWILKEAKKRNIPITIGTDAHVREQIGKELKFAYNLAKEAGYTSIVRFKARKMISIKLD